MAPWGLNDCFRPPCTLHCTILLLCGMHIFSVMHIGYEWVFNLFYSRIILAICNFIELLLITTVNFIMLYNIFPCDLHLLLCIFGSRSTISILIFRCIHWFIKSALNSLVFLHNFQSAHFSFLSMWLKSHQECSMILTYNRSNNKKSQQYLKKKIITLHGDGKMATLLAFLPTT